MAVLKVMFEESNPCYGCSRPGACCQKMHLGNWANSNRQWKKLFKKHGLPFHPLFKTNGFWYHGCNKLDKETGLCSDHDNRPDVCRHYEVGIDGLCTKYEKYVPPEERGISLTRNTLK